jgi:colanic acid biosynthesis glycosyl transferase WcaI
MWPGSAISSGVLKSKIIATVFFILQRLTYKISSIITVISDDMAEKVIKQKVPLDKVKEIPNWFDSVLYEISWNDNLFASRYNLLKSEFYIQYAGTVGNVFDYKCILYAAERTIDTLDMKYIIVGQGVKLEEFKNCAVEKKLTNILFFPYQSQEMVPHVYSSCSVQVIPLKKGVIGNSVPSKLPLVYACKRTAICSVDKDSMFLQMINKNEIGIAVSNESYDEFLNAILKLYTNRQLLIRFSENGFIFTKEKYSREHNTKKYIDIFETLTMNVTKETEVI